jgi:hypothetical protein
MGQICTQHFLRTLIDREIAQIDSVFGFVKSQKTGTKQCTNVPSHVLFSCVRLSKTCIHA